MPLSHLCFIRCHHVSLPMTTSFSPWLWSCTFWMHRVLTSCLVQTYMHQLVWNTLTTVSSTVSSYTIPKWVSDGGAPERQACHQRGSFCLDKNSPLTFSSNSTVPFPFTTASILQCNCYFHFSVQLSPLSFVGFLFAWMHRRCAVCSPFLWEMTGTVL